MDYGSGETFLFADWKQFGAPAFKIGVFQKQSEEEFVIRLNIPNSLRFLR